MNRKSLIIVIVMIFFLFNNFSVLNLSLATIEKKEIPKSEVNTLDGREKESLGLYDITWKKHIIDTTFDYAFGVFACDVDNDKDCDILGAAQNGDFIAWWRNDGGNPINWTKLLIDDHFDGATSVFAVDIDGDLDVDVVGSSWQAQEIALWINDGGTPITWRKSVIKSGFAFAHEAYCYDLDQDGNMDIFGASTDNDQIVWWKNNGGNPISWTEQIISSDFDGAKSARVADFDNDGLLDVVGTAFYDDEIRWWRNCGGVPIVWEEHIIIDNWNGSHRVEPCDMDFDGDMDLVGAAYWEGELAWWRNDGGTPIRWTKRVIATNFNGACTGLPVDVDEDGDIDVIGTAQQAYDVTLFRNDGGNLFTWTKVVIDSSFFGAWPCYVYDIDGDGDVDIVAGASFGDKLAWWESNLNQQPFQPERPSGVASGKSGTEYVFSSRTIDPFSLDLYYLWDWGDGTISEWSGPYHSGETCSASHIWSNRGNYEIKVKAKNIDNAESDWSDPLPITMPYTMKNPLQQFLAWLFQWFPYAFPLLQYLMRH